MVVPQEVLIAAPSLSKSEKQEESSSIVTNGSSCIQQNGSSKKTGKSTNGLNHQASVFYPVFYFNINKSSPDKEVDMRGLNPFNSSPVHGGDGSYQVVGLHHRNIKSEESNSFQNGSIRVMQSDSSEESGDSLEEAFGGLNLQKSQRLTRYAAAPKRVPRSKLRGSPTYSLGDYMKSVSPKKEVEKTDYNFPRLRRDLHAKENAPASTPTNLPKKSHDEKENTSPNVSNPNGHGLDINLNEVMTSDEGHQELKNHAPNISGPLQESNFQVADQPSAQIENCEHSFLLSAKLCGRLIGKRGSHVKQIMEMTGVSVEVRRQAIPTPDDELHFVVLSGPKNTMMKARQMIRNRFPLDKFPDVNLDVARVPVFSQEIGLPETRFLLRVSYITGSATVYVQQPEHHAFFQHAYFQQNMTNYYRNNSSPPVLNPLPGDIYVYECESLHYPAHGSACNPIREIACHRVEVVELAEDDCIVVKNVDYGGLWTVPVDSLRQMLPEFFKLPFLATECALWNIQPNGPGWSQAAFDHLVSCSKGFMYGQVYQVDSINYICLYRILPNNIVVCINDEMVMMDMAANTAMVPQGVDGAIIASQGLNGFTVQPEAAAAMAHQGMNNGFMDPQVAAAMASQGMVASMPPQGAEPEMIPQQMVAFMAPQESDTAHPELVSSVAPLEEKAELAPAAGDEEAELAQQ